MLESWSDKRARASRVIVIAERQPVARWEGHTSRNGSELSTPESTSPAGRMAALEQQAKLGDTPRRLPPISPSGDSGGSSSGGGAAGGDESSGCPDRERLLNDILNTGVMGALIGGFALSNVQMSYDFSSSLNIAVYMCSFVGVHACTCSCVCSALLYRVANSLSDAEAPRWAKKNATLLALPMMKFGFGCLCYLLSVVLISYRDLAEVELWQWIALIIGAMSMSITLITAVVLARDHPIDITQVGLKQGESSDDL